MTVSAVAVFGLLSALLERRPDSVIPQVEVVVELVRIHEHGHRDPVLHENKVLTLLVQAAYQPAEVAAGFGNAGVVNQGACRAVRDWPLVKMMAPGQGRLASQAAR